MWRVILWCGWCTGVESDLVVWMVHWGGESFCDDGVLLWTVMLIV